MKCIDKVIENICKSINDDFENNKVTEDTFTMINSLSTLVESKKETAQELKVQEQLSGPFFEYLTKCIVSYQNYMVKKGCSNKFNQH